MRFEATLPDGRGQALVELARELGISRSQLMDEALALFLKMVIETRQGRRLCFVDPTGTQPPCEVATPSLAVLEWTSHRQHLEVSPQELEQIASLTHKPAPPTQALVEAMKGEG